MDAEPPAIRAVRLTKTYSELDSARPTVSVMQDFLLEVKESSFTVLHGPNGCGKSTLIHILAGVEGYDCGEVEVLGESPDKANIGIVFQNYASTLFPWLNVLENIIFPVHSLHMSKRVAREKAKLLLQEIGFSEILTRLGAYPYELSGGQQQLVAIARALITEPPVLLLDEPFSALDARHRDDAMLNVQRFCKDKGITCLFAIHDLDDAIVMADSLVILGPAPMRVKGIVNVHFTWPRTRMVLLKADFFELRRNVLEIAYGEN